MKQFKKYFLIIAMGFLFLGAGPQKCGTADPGTPTPSPTPGTSPTPTPPPSATPSPTPIGQEPAFSKAFVIVFENTSGTDVIKQPYFSSLAKEGAYLTNFFAVTHPSQPNYIAMTSGSLNGVSGNGSTNLNVANIADLVQAAGKSWKVYAEDYPGHCFTGGSSGKYVRKHNSFISYLSIQKDPAMCAHIVNAQELVQDVKNNTVPDYTFFIPNLDNDGHDTGVKFADTYLKNTFGALFSDPNFLNDRLVAVTFDEDDGGNSNKIYTVLLGSGVVPGKTSAKKSDHYSLLRTIEDQMKLGSLHKKDETAQPIDDVWK